MEMLERMSGQTFEKTQAGLYSAFSVAVMGFDKEKYQERTPDAPMDWGAISPTSSELGIVSLECRAKPFRKVEMLPLARETVITLPDKSVRTVISLSKLAPMSDCGCVSDFSIRKFVELHDHCVMEGFIGYGQLGPITAIPLKECAERPSTAMIVEHVFSDHSVGELNRFLGCDCFVEEGCLGNYQWPDIVPAA
jgi:hypothetical protein